MEMPLPENTPHQDISLILRDFLRTIKAVCMYPENNSLPQSLRQSLAGRLLDLVDDVGELRLSVDRASLLYQGAIVHRDKSREDNLAGIFFSAGITEFTFHRGLSVDGLNRLLDTLRTYLTAPAESQDLPALLWEENIGGFAFQSAEDIALAEYDVNFRIQEYFQNEDDKRLTESGRLDAGLYEAVFLNAEDLDRERINPTVDGNLPPSALFNIDRAEAEKLHAQEAMEAMGLGNLPPQPLPSQAVIVAELKASREELRRLEQLLAEDAVFDMYESTTVMLVELLMQETTLKGFGETAIICERILSEYIKQGKLAEAAFLLISLRMLGKRIRSEKPRWTERIDDILVTAGSRDRLHLVTTALNEKADINGDDLRRYLDVFDWQALSGITDLLGELEHRPHRDTLCAYLVERGRGKEEILAKGIYDKRWYVVRNSVMILGHIGDDRALQHLSHAIKHEDRRVRIELIEALKRHSDDPRVLDILRQLVYDADEEIHREALQAIMTFSGPEAFAAISVVVTAESFGKLDPAEQVALLIAYSRVGREQAVGYLAGHIERYNPLRNPIRTFMRTAAFDALEQNPSEKAAKLLAKYAGSWRPDIKRRAEHVLARRKNMGGNQ